MIEVRACIYNQPDLQIKRIVDLKFEYFLSKNSFIKSVLQELDELVTFRVGSVESIRKKVSEKRPESAEEITFIKEVQAFIA